MTLYFFGQERAVKCPLFLFIAVLLGKKVGEGGFFLKHKPQI
jgi:hypothetical protein